MDWSVILPCFLIGMLSYIWGWARGRIAGKREHQRHLEMALEAAKAGYEAGRRERDRP